MYGLNFNGSIDNVSVKEITGQEVASSGCPSLLLEPASTNLITYSEDFSDISWGFDDNNSRITRVISNVASPIIGKNATKLIGNNTSRNPNTAYIAASATSATYPYTSSVFAKKGEYDYLIMSVGSFASGYWASFNLDNGTVNSQPSNPNTDANIENIGNGWYRCSLTTSSSNLAIHLLTPSVDGTLNTSYTNTTNGVYVDGAQFEALPYATSYIPTNGSIATRVEEYITKNDVSHLIGQNEGSFILDTSDSSNDVELFSLGRSTVGSLIVYRSNGEWKLISYDTSGVIKNRFLGSPSDSVKLAVTYKTGEYKAAINGAIVLSYTDFTWSPSSPISKFLLNPRGYVIGLRGKCSIKSLVLNKHTLTEEELIDKSTQ